MPSLGYRKPLSEKFWARVNKTDSCWLWTGDVRGGWEGHRYGCVRMGPVRISTHRLSWEIHFGKIPQGKFVCHRCDNTLCVRPDHLFLGTAQTNQDDCKAKGRSTFGERNGRAVVTAEIVLMMRLLHRWKGIGGAELGRRYGLHKDSVYSILRRRNWKHI